MMTTKRTTMITGKTTIKVTMAMIPHKGGFRPPTTKVSPNDEGKFSKDNNTFFFKLVVGLTNLVRHWWAEHTVYSTTSPRSPP